MQTESLNSSAFVEVFQNSVVSRIHTSAEHLAKDYDIKNPQEVADFISENLFLLGLLEEIPSQIRKYFGKDQKLTLEFFLDPEDINWHRLWVRVPTRLSVSEVMSKMNEFDENWWVDNEELSNSKISIRSEYIK